MDYRNEEFEIDFTGLLLYLKKKIRVIAAVVLVCALAGFLASAVFMTPKYTASTRVYILNRSNDRYASSDFVIASYMLNDYQVLITGRNVTEAVVKDLKLDMEPSALAGKIAVSSPENTRVLQIDYTDPDPKQAARIANAVREEAVKQLQSIMEVDAVKLIYAAETPRNPSSPDVGKCVLICGIAGFVIMSAVYITAYILDDAIRTEEDVERYLGLNTLGVIPAAKDLSSEQKKKNKIPLKAGSGRKK